MVSGERRHAEALRDEAAAALAPLGLRLAPGERRRRAPAPGGRCRKRRCDRRVRRRTAECPTRAMAGGSSTATQAAGSRAANTTSWTRTPSEGGRRQDSTRSLPAGRRSSARPLPPGARRPPRELVLCLRGCLTTPVTSQSAARSRSAPGRNDSAKPPGQLDPGGMIGLVRVMARFVTYPLWIVLPGDCASAGAARAGPVIAAVSAAAPSSIPAR